jgi:hypothetical protein
MQEFRILACQSRVVTVAVTGWPTWHCRIPSPTAFVRLKRALELGGQCYDFAKLCSPKLRRGVPDEFLKKKIVNKIGNYYTYCKTIAHVAF